MDACLIRLAHCNLCWYNKFLTSDNEWPSGMTMKDVCNSFHVSMSCKSNESIVDVESNCCLKPVAAPWPIAVFVREDR